MKLTPSKKNEAKLELLKVILKLTKTSKLSEKEKKTIINVLDQKSVDVS